MDEIPGQRVEEDRGRDFLFEQKRGETEEGGLIRLRWLIEGGSELW